MSHSQQLKVEHPRKLTSRQSISCQYWMGLGWFRAKPYPSPCSCAGPAVLHEGSDGALHIPQAKLSSTSPNQQRKVPKQAYIAGCVDVDWCWLPDYAWLADWYFLVFGQCSIYIWDMGSARYPPIRPQLTTCNDQEVTSPCQCRHDVTRPGQHTGTAVMKVGPGQRDSLLNSFQDFSGTSWISWISWIG